MSSLNSSPSYTIRVRNESGQVARVQQLRHAVQTLLTLTSVPSCEVDILITTNKTLRQLNCDFRAVDEATDVLSFPGPGWVGAPLGDIAISMEFAKAGAAARKVPVGVELAYLAVHGGLHLLGHDDQTPGERDTMVRRMNEVMVAAGLPTDENWHSQPHREKSC